MTSTATPTTALEHELAPGGLVAIETIETEVRLRAVTGRIGRIRLLNGDLSADFRVETAPGLLAVRAIRRWPFGWRRVGGPLEVEVPRDARVDVRTASGSVLALDLGRGVHVRTASGDVELAMAGGEVVVNAVSGAIRVRASSSVSLELASVSGRIDAVAASATRVTARSMSGALRLMAALRGPGPFSLETVSGGITLGTDAPVRLMASTISGEIRSDVDGAGVAHGRGLRTMAVGWSGPEVSARTVSGGIQLVAWREDPAPAPAPEPAAPEAEADPATDSGRETRARPDTNEEAAPVAAPDGPAASGEPGDAPWDSPDEEARLRILRALAEGEITVAEAGDRIDALEAPAGG